MRFIPVALIIAGCATTPTPNFQAERSRVFDRTDVLCFVASLQSAKDKWPEGYEIVVAELTQRNATCTPEMVQTGAQAIVAQSEREGRIAATQSQERQESATRIGDRVLRGLAGFAAGYAIGTAMTPPPPRPIQCHTSYTYGGANTTCQ